MKLHLGCGYVRKSGYVNVDIRDLKTVDVVHDVTDTLPWGDSSCERIEAYHLLEHLPRRKVAGALAEWHRVSQPGGVLIVEVPNFDVACREYLAGNDKRLNAIFGLQRWEGDTHLFGYNVKRLTRLLREAGFSDIAEFPATTRRSGGPPCIRLEAVA